MSLMHSFIALPTFIKCLWCEYFFYFFFLLSFAGKQNVSTEWMFVVIIMCWMICIPVSSRERIKVNDIVREQERERERCKRRISKCVNWFQNHSCMYFVITKKCFLVQFYLVFFFFFKFSMRFSKHSYVIFSTLSTQRHLNETAWTDMCMCDKRHLLEYVLAHACTFYFFTCSHFEQTSTFLFISLYCTLNFFPFSYFYFFFFALTVWLCNFCIDSNKKSYTIEHLCVNGYWTLRTNLIHLIAISSTFRSLPLSLSSHYTHHIVYAVFFKQWRSGYKKWKEKYFTWILYTMPWLWLWQLKTNFFFSSFFNDGE